MKIKWKSQFLLSGIMLLYALSLSAREVTLYRTILATYTTLQEAQRAARGQQEVVEQGAFLVVEGFYQRFADALPEGAPRDPKTAWKHVYATEVEESSARGKGLNVEPSLREQGRQRNSDFISQSRNISNLIQQATDVIQAASAQQAQAGATLDQVVELLKPSEAPLLAAIEKSSATDTIVFSRLNLGKLYYLQGLLESRRRLPDAKQRQLLEMTGLEANAFQSALEQFAVIAEMFPRSRESEEAEYYAAVTRYNMVHHGHEVHQYRLALAAHDAYLERYPYSQRVLELKVNKQDITLELARRGEAEFDEVIALGASFFAVHRDAPANLIARSNLLIAIALMDGFKEYQQTIDIAEYIINDFPQSAIAQTDDLQSTIGTAHRTLAYAQYFANDYAGAVNTWNQYITNGFTRPEYNGYFRVTENTAAAHFWRGYTNWKLGNVNDALPDFQYVLQEHPNTEWSFYSNEAVTTIKNEEF